MRHSITCSVYARHFATIVLLVMLFQLSGCTILGYRTGQMFDNMSRRQKVVPLEQLTDSLQTGKTILIQGEDGHYYEGALVSYVRHESVTLEVKDGSFLGLGGHTLQVTVPWDWVEGVSMMGPVGPATVIFTSLGAMIDYSIPQGLDDIYIAP